MTYSDPLQSLDVVSRSDRAEAESQLRRAFAEGRISAGEFDARMGRVITAESAAELAAAVAGPAPAPVFSGTVQRRTASFDQGQVLAVIAHLSPFLTWLIGPAVIWAVSPQGSYAKLQAAKAFNFQLVAFVIGIGVGIVGGLLPGDGNVLQPIWTVIWAVLTVIGGVQAARGAEWQNPLTRVLHWEVFPERHR